MRTLISLFLAAILSGCTATAPQPSSEPTNAASPGAKEAAVTDVAGILTPASDGEATPPVASGGHDHSAHATPVASASDDKTVYTCSHHPEVRSEKPGDCPKCKMTLKPAATKPAATTPATQPAHHDHGDHGGGQ